MFQQRQKHWVLRKTNCKMICCIFHLLPWLEEKPFIFSLHESVFLVCGPENNLQHKGPPPERDSHAWSIESSLPPNPWEKGKQVAFRSLFCAGPFFPVKSHWLIMPHKERVPLLQQGFSVYDVMFWCSLNWWNHLYKMDTENAFLQVQIYSWGFLCKH